MIIKTEHLIISNKEPAIPDFQFYLNNDNEIFVEAIQEVQTLTPFFTISKKDWLLLKEFIDQQFK